MPQVRHRILPDHGVLMISTDLHGNLGDFIALRDHFLEALRHRDIHWAILGDLVHGPDARSRCRCPRLYDFDDRSWDVVEHVEELRARYPERVHLLLGNHDHGHVGGPHTSKFHPDEVEHLEASLDEDQRRRLRALFADALLLLLAPCGLLMSHGSPDASLIDARQVDTLSLRYEENDAHGQWLLSTLLTSYGQSDDIAASVLRYVSRQTGLELGVVVHGHDRDESGFYREGHHQLCPVLFGACRGEKRFVRVDLGAHYEDVDALRDGVEILHLYDSRPSAGA